MKKTRLIMGMPISIETVGSPEKVMVDAIERAFRRLVWVDEIFSTYKPDSEISRINRGELTVAEAHMAVREVLDACEVMREKTDGYFDIHHAREIDPSGYVKGWAIKDAAGILDGAGVERYIVEAGGDLQARGTAGDGGPWRVGIRHPEMLDKIVKVLGINNGAVATSGTYIRGMHIYDPHSGRAAASLASMTVLGPDIVTADVYATAAFAMGKPGAAWVAKQGLECYVIGHDGVAVYSPGMAKYFL